MGSPQKVQIHAGLFLYLNTWIFINFIYLNIDQSCIKIYYLNSLSMDNINKNKTGKIAVFDSGIGGLTVLEHLVREMPNYDFDYFGDVARAPYGDRSVETIIEFTEQSIRFLFEEGAEIVILACNTSSAVALKYLQNKFLSTPKFKNKKILGIIRPTAEFAVENTNAKSLGVIGTAATIKSGACKKELLKIDKDLSVLSVPCPLLAHLVEEGLEDTEIAINACKMYMSKFDNTLIDTLILSCTHYPFLKNVIRSVTGQDVNILEQGPIVAIKTIDYLDRNRDIELRLSKKSKIRLFTSDQPERLRHLCVNYLALQ